MRFYLRALLPATLLGIIASLLSYLVAIKFDSGMVMEQRGFPVYYYQYVKVNITDHYYLWRLVLNTLFWIAVAYLPVQYLVWRSSKTNSAKKDSH